MLNSIIKRAKLFFKYYDVLVKMKRKLTFIYVATRIIALWHSLWNLAICDFTGQNTLQMWLSYAFWDGEIILDDLRGPNVITRVLPRERGRQESERNLENGARWWNGWLWRQKGLGAKEAERIRNVLSP